MNDIDKNLLLNLCRITGIESIDILDIDLLKDIDWDNYFRIAYKNNVIYLLYHNMINLGLNNYIPTHYSRLIEDSLSCNLIRNNNKLKEMKKLCYEMFENSISFIPVKGGYLIDNIYKNRRIRITNDIDILIRRKDIASINKAMLKHGYIQGEYDKFNNKVVMTDRKKKLLYKTTMYNLLPYIKIDHGFPNATVLFDFSFALDFSLDTCPVEEMLDNAIQTSDGAELLPEHFLVHMCCHHYREASNVAWILIGKDLSLIKFCDVREFILQKMDSESIKKAVQFAKKHGLQKAIYFTIYFTREIYNDGYEADILKALEITDETFLYQFGEKDYDELQTKKKDFWTSLFSENNKDEITKDPKYKSLIEVSP